MGKRLFKTVVLALFALSAAFVSGAPVKIACVGDSITYGEGMSPEIRAKMAYPAQLGRMLGDAYKVENFGRSGATLIYSGDQPYVKYKTCTCYADSLAFLPDIVVIKLGTNDSRQENRDRLDQMEADMAKLVKAYRSLPSKPKVYLCLPAPAFTGNWTVDEAIMAKTIRPAILKFAQENGLEIIDTYSPFVGRPELFIKDGIHPSVEGATVLAKTVAAKIK